MLVLRVLALSILNAQLTSGYTNSVAELLSRVPTCAHHCVVAAFFDFNCDLADVAACVCTNIALQNTLSECTQISCVFSDQVVAAEIEMDLCSTYPKPSRSSQVTRIVVAGCVLVIPTIFLRLYARAVYTKKLWLDDYMTIFATILLVVLAAINLYNARLGFGMHYWTIPVVKGTLILKLVYLNSIVYMALLSAGKLAILLVYLRIFPNQHFRYMVYGLIAVITIHGVLFSLLTALQCLPVDSIWDRYITNRRCINVNSIVYSSGILSIFEDVAILALPIRQIWLLQVHRRKRLTLIALFGVGSLWVYFTGVSALHTRELIKSSACLTSMVRMKYVVQYSATFDATWDSVDIVAWSAIEQFTAMFCGSLPALRPLFRSVGPENCTDLGSRASNRCKKAFDYARRRKGHHAPEPIQEKGSQQPGTTSQRPQPTRPQPTCNNIHVTTTIDVTSEPLTWYEDGSDRDTDDKKRRNEQLQQPRPFSSGRSASVRGKSKHNQDLNL